jgi:hypothetical protein
MERSASKTDQRVKVPEKTEQFTQVELKRLKIGMTREVSKIKYPKRQDFKPFVFNNLSPYFDMKDTEVLVNSPEKMNNVGYYNRYTALTIVEPWVSYRMEQSVAPIISRNLNHNAGGNRSSLEDSSMERPKKGELEGSTLAPNFPKVIIKKPKDMNGPFYFDDVPVIRKELKNNLTNHTRFEEDRNRTINDYYRMNLDSTAEKEKMKDAYHAYLENTPGSKKALQELLSRKHVLAPVKNDKNDTDSDKKHSVRESLPEKNITYTVTVNTGSSLGSGTDSEIGIEIIGTKGKIERLILNNSVTKDQKKKDLFEDSDVDIFVIEGKNIGKITGIKIGYDGEKKSFGPDWECRSVIIESEIGKEE